MTQKSRVPSHTFLDALVSALEAAGTYNKQDQAPPAAVLWTDEQCQWEELIPQIRDHVPVFTLGSYEPEARRGPAYWLRCIVDRTVEHAPPEDVTPILYLPEISRQMVRATGTCPRELQPLAELQYRGVLWTQKNARDWTITAFLQSKEDGLGLDVGADGASQEALRRSLAKLADQTLSVLRAEAPIRAPFLNSLLHPDEVRRVLDWLSAPEAMRSSVTSEEWSAFADLCRTQYDFDPDADGPIAATRLLGQRNGQWDGVWQRFEEAPARYTTLPEKLRQARPEKLLPSVGRVASWPQDNEEAETSLREGLSRTAALDPESARRRILELEQEHGGRRVSVWASLGRSPLASALEHLAQLARESGTPLAGSTVQELVISYSSSGWQTDWAVVRALAEVASPDDTAAVGSVVRTLYRSWLDEGATAFQAALSSEPSTYVAMTPPDLTPGTCVLFTDGLRYDLANELAKVLGASGAECTVTAALAALPSVTMTGKPAVSPAAHSFSEESPPALEPALGSTGSKMTTASLRAEIAAAGVQVLSSEELGDSSGYAWTEFGTIDARGHARESSLAREVGGELGQLALRIESLMRHGWQRVVVVTDHGWLLLPGGLPKAELPEHLTALRKGRCALLKPGTQVSIPRFSWHWNPDVEFAAAPGISCFVAGKDYEHGGVSPQECVVPIVSVAESSAGPAPSVGQIVWRGLRCNVTINNPSPGTRVDIRARVGDASSSLADNGKELTSDGSAALFIHDDRHEGAGAVVVIVGENGAVISQASTIVGGE